MKEWKEYKLVEFMQFNPKERIAKGQVARKIAMDQLVPFCRDVSSNIYEEYKGGAKFKNGDTIMARITPCLENGKTSYISSLKPDEVAFGSTEYIVLRNIQDVSDSRFVYYLSICPQIREVAIKSMVGSSGRQRVQQDVLENYCMNLPSLPTQQKIANILSSLDDKIEVNRRINEQLEELAQALFKSWFVDFEPFKDGEFVESELGMIPEGWKVCELKDFGQIICGKTPSKDNKDFYGGNIPFIKIPDMHNNIFVWNTTDWLSNKGDASQVNKRIPPYSICVSCIATVGLVAINTTFAHTNQQINTIIPNNAFERYYLFEQLKSMKEYIQNLGRGGTATLNVNTRLFGSIKVLRPSEKVLKEYDGVINGFFKKIELNQQEITHLTNLRDTLLPKLMSGEIDVEQFNVIE